MTELFRAILIETCNICTRQCWFCKFGQERQDNAMCFMDMATITGILENLRDLDYRGRISWYNINEPLLDRRMPEIIRMTRDYCPHAFISLATNGDLLDDTLFRDLKNAGLDVLGVSVYDDRIFEKASRMADPQMVLMDMRSDRIDCLENRGGNIRRQNNVFERDLDRFRARSCIRPFTMMVINPRGQAILCCNDLYADVVMGDVRGQRLEEIWNNERFATFRTVLERGERQNLPLCSGCSYSGEGFRPFFPLNDTKPARSLMDRIRNCLGNIRGSF